MYSFSLLIPNFLFDNFHRLHHLYGSFVVYKGPLLSDFLGDYESLTLTVSWTTETSRPLLLSRVVLGLLLRY